METTGPIKAISIIGLGQMGRKMAEIYRDNGYQVTVWNRNAAKARDIQNILVAETAGAAIAQNRMIIICVLDNAAVSSILDHAGDELFQNKIIVNLTTGSPAEVRALEARLEANGAGYLNGAIQVAPEQMGQPDTTILMGGKRTLFEETMPALAVLGGNIKYLGEKGAASPAMDLATLSWVYGSYIGLLYGAALVQQEGMQLNDYKEIVGEIAPSFLEFFKHEIDMISVENYNITQSPLAISVGATRRIAEAVVAAGLDGSFTDTMAELLRKSQERGYENQELTAVLKVIANP